MAKDHRESDAGMSPALVGVVLQAIVATLIEAACIAIPQDGAGCFQDAEQVGFVGQASESCSIIHYGMPIDR